MSEKLEFSNTSLIVDQINLQERSWNEFELKDLIEITGSTTISPRVIETMQDDK